VVKRQATFLSPFANDYTDCKENALATFQKQPLRLSSLLTFSLSHHFPTMPRKSFSELINSPGMPVLVDFYADWCGPCKTMAPILEQVASQHQGKLRVIKIDVDKNQAVAQQFKVQSIPTLILFHKGQPVWRQAGVVPAAQIGQVVSQHQH
jgi:thioredoxin 1